MREQKGITQAQVANALNLSTNAISNYETGIRSMSVKILEKYVAFLNYKIDIKPKSEAGVFPKIDFSDPKCDWFQQEKIILMMPGIITKI
ncbi:helix-turn-helix domain-containing protein [Bacillus mycoides]|uniref:helix-turn-helix domain-containing protein n=1 Tax=Bacillus mycoides TaxID=1405 RepID=UPI000B4B3333|nr:helix-turn-helix transcriptional regulator [Bacillus mycoides]